MNKTLSGFIMDFKFTNDLEKDFYKFLVHHDLHDVAHHSYMVASKAKEIAKAYSVDEEAALIAGYLHDIGNIPKAEERIIIAREFGLTVLPEEEKYSGILHQKLSRVMAEELFNIKNLEILSAIECHTTLRRDAAALDLVLFVADKLQWDGEHNKAFKKDILKGLDVSLQHGAYAYLKYSYDNKNNMIVVHPWLLEAYYDLCNRCN